MLVAAVDQRSGSFVGGVCLGTGRSILRMDVLRTRSVCGQLLGGGRSGMIRQAARVCVWHHDLFSQFQRSLVRIMPGKSDSTTRIRSRSHLPLVQGDARRKLRPHLNLNNPLPDGNDPLRGCQNYLCRGKGGSAQRVSGLFYGGPSVGNHRRARGRQVTCASTQLDFRATGCHAHVHVGMLI